MIQMMLDDIINSEKSFTYTKEKIYGACANLSPIDSNMLPKELHEKTKYYKWYYFNRLVVNTKIRHQDIATKLMNDVIQWADINTINIFLEINPYGDLNLDQLIKFYKKFNFKHFCKQKNMMIRIMKGEQKI